MQILNKSAFWATLALATTLVACGDEAEDNNATTDQGALEIEGQWASSFGGTEAIGSGKWLNMEVVEYSNADNWIVTQNAADDQYNPSKFNRIVWTEPKDGSFYYCFVAFGLDSADAAKNSTKTADSADPANSGCGDFSWTKLTDSKLVLEVRGDYWSNYDTGEVISTEGWDKAKVVSFDNENNWVITQNAVDAEFSPGKFNRIVWTEPKDGSFYYCTVDFGLDSEDDAKNSMKMADDSDPENSGCGDFGWTKLTDRATLIAVVGKWDSNFETKETINAKLWDKMNLIEFNNTERWAITQNAEDSEFDPGKYLRIVWTPVVDNSFYYCMVDFGLDSADAARSSTKMADDSDPEKSGCGEYPWTKLTRAQ